MLACGRLQVSVRMSLSEAQQTRRRFMPNRSVTDPSAARLSRYVRSQTRYRLHVTIPMIIVVVTVLLVVALFIMDLAVPETSHMLQLIMWATLGLVSLAGVLFCGRALLRLPSSDLSGPAGEFKDGFSGWTRIKASMPSVMNGDKRTPSGLVAATIFGSGIVGLSVYSGAYILMRKRAPHIALPISAIALACFIGLSVFETYRVVLKRESKSFTGPLPKLDDVDSSPGDIQHDDADEDLSEYDV